MPIHQIKIIEGDPSSGKLKLSDGGDSRVNTRDTVTWILDPGTEVDSITAIKRKKFSLGIFKTGPEAQTGSSNWIGGVNGIPYVTYNYSISWKGTDGLNHVHDPKISVKPTGFALFKIILMVVGIFFGLFSLKFLHKKKEL